MIALNHWVRAELSNLGLASCWTHPTFWQFINLRGLADCLWSIVLKSLLLRPPSSVVMVEYNIWLKIKSSLKGSNPCSCPRDESRHRMDVRCTGRASSFFTSTKGLHKGQCLFQEQPHKVRDFSRRCSGLAGLIFVVSCFENSIFSSNYEDLTVSLLLSLRWIMLQLF